VLPQCALSCYTVDSDDSDYEDVENNEEVNDGTKDKRIDDFGDLYIKEEITEDGDNPIQNWHIDKSGYKEPTEELLSTQNEGFLQPQDIKVEIESDSDSSSSSSSGSDSDSSSDDEDEATNTKCNNDNDDPEKSESTGPPKTANELLTKDLPPVEEIFASVPASECTVVGHIKNFVEDLVVVESLIGIAALNLETVLFVNEGQLALGRVFDVIGPVTQPLYVVRFNSRQHIDDKGITTGMKVYFAPKSDELTNYVFIEQLMAMKISDASWVNDEEPPPQFLEYSDDEEEQKAKKELKMKKKGVVTGEATEPKRPRESKDTHQQKNLRHCNNRYTADSNPFYRTSRSYNPGQSGGGIQWSQFNTPAPYNQFSHPPPPPVSGQYYPHPQYYPHYSPAAAVPPSAVSPYTTATAGPPPAVSAAAWQSQYNPYQQLASNISFSQQQQQPQPQINSSIPNFDLPPPPPPGE